MELNTTQTAWLAKNNLKMTIDASGTIEIEPIGANVWDGEYYSVRQWYGAGKFGLTRSWVSYTFPEMPAPAAKDVAEYSTLHAALKDLVGR